MRILICKILLLGVIVLSACAKQPEQRAAADIGEAGCESWSCRQLTSESTSVSANLENLSAKQRSAASGDSVGVFLLGLPLSSMSGNDQETNIAVAKGQLQAVEQVMVDKNC